MEFCKIWFYLFLRHSRLVALCGLGVLALTFEISGISVLELNLFLNTLQVLARKPNLLCLSPERCVTDHTDISMRGLSGRDSRPKVLLHNRATFFAVNILVKNQIVREPRCSRTEV